MGQMYGNTEHRHRSNVKIEDKGFHIHSDELLEIVTTNSDGKLHIFSTTKSMFLAVDVNLVNCYYIVNVYVAVQIYMPRLYMRVKSSL